MTLRFLVDAQLPPDLAMQMRLAGNDAIHVVDLGLLRASDATIWRTAEEIGAVVISKDEDFVTLAKRTTNGPQVMWIRFGNVGNATLWLRLAPVLDDIQAALAAGERVVEVL